MSTTTKLISTTTTSRLIYSRNASKLTTKVSTKTILRNKIFQQTSPHSFFYCYHSSSSIIRGHHYNIPTSRTTTPTKCYSPRFISTNNTVIKRYFNSSRHIPSSDELPRDDERKTTTLHDNIPPENSSSPPTTTFSQSIDNETTNPLPSNIPICYIENGLHNTNNLKHKKLLTPYTTGWAWQQIILHRRLDYQRRQKKMTEGGNNDSRDDHSSLSPMLDDYDSFDDHDRLLFFEHDPVYTLGRGADESYITFLSNHDDEQRRRLSRRSSRDGDVGSARLRWNANDDVRKMTVNGLVERLEDSIHPVTAPNNVPIYRVDRGGEVTFHGPGQLVCYPLVDLRLSPPYRKDLHWYLRAIEEVIIRTLMVYGIEGRRDDENTGVWVKDDKIAAVGISSSRWITTHGFAINVSPDLSYFDTSVIIPCGIEGKGVTSIMKEIMTTEQQQQQQRRRGIMVGDEKDCCCPTVEDVARVTVKSFESVFGVMTRRGDLLR